MQETATINQSMVVYTLTNNDIPNHSGQNVVHHWKNSLSARPLLDVGSVICTFTNNSNTAANCVKKGNVFWRKFYQQVVVNLT